MRDAELRLAELARRYAEGDLRPDEAAAFELRLGEDQAAREALARAVALSETPARSPAPRPDPRYRSAVRRRLLAPHGRPALWALAGAAAALLVMLPLWGFHAGPGSAEQPPITATQPAQQPPDEAPAAEAAQVWAEINGSERLQKAYDEQQRRKTRQEERRSARSSQNRADRYVGQPMIMMEQ
jgi:hypothetical protein